ncbi:MAG: glutamine--fructose-6-phosphate transaminase (isomerizing) [Oceanospirillaceae bacterium]|jgi:glucosamine--fructose-6-phosphate aminotransferase (isomerizing)|nr:glutamine--fructose-6-phosphate transaminase (isomerizing) [Oceanospirillaceae bacterium]MBT6076345.1 glutamine--fructose-6-phosphate transaminase (isomerizing) [Oceanospirillaceae bacterium]MBT7330544.1 glutamine--fructose-6-phosphate transaminase (isomerizing) [Oceanospirillaceae bacterium]
MCGIVGAIAQRNISGILLEGLKRLEYRGYDSSGVAILSDKGLHRTRRVGKVASLDAALSSEPLQGGLGIAHTRWATHGIPNETNAHPHWSHSCLAVVHNGIIDNFERIKADLVATGYGFESDTDTEAIAHLIHRNRQQGMTLTEAVRDAAGRCEGAYALGVVDETQPDLLLAARKGSPLVIGLGSDENYIASDQLALLQVTDRFMFLEDGDIAEISRTQVTVTDAHGVAVERPSHRYEHSEESSDKGVYKHYMLKEINEQPKVVAKLIEQQVVAGQLQNILNDSDMEALSKANNVQIIACGTSYLAGMVAKYWIESLAGIACQIEVASEYRYRQAVVPQDTLLITLSQSGETADSLAALRHIDRSKLAASLAICNVPSSSLVRESDMVLLTQAGPEISVASTKAFTTQLITLLHVTLLLAKQRSAIDTQPIIEAMQTLPGILQQCLQMESKIELVAQRFADKQHTLFLGRGSMYPIATEGALKLKEVSYIHAEAYPAGELKHGPLALVDADMPVVVVAPKDDMLDKLKANMQEVRARGGELFVFADAHAKMAADEATHVIVMPEVHELLAPVVYAIPMQLLSYHVAIIKGTDVDQPRNLAKSVTVE